MFRTLNKEAPMKYFGPVIALAVFAACGFAQDAPKKVTRAEAFSDVVLKPQPEYPSMAKQLHVEGTVELEALITETGAVGKVTIVSGNPMLTAPSVECIKKWKFKPFMAEGKAITVLAPITLNYKL
jgi:protein TonB